MILDTPIATEFHLLSRGTAGARTLSAALRIQGVAVGRFLADRLIKEDSAIQLVMPQASLSQG